MRKSRSFFNIAYQSCTLTLSLYMAGVWKTIDSNSLTSSSQTGKTTCNVASLIRFATTCIIYEINSTSMQYNKKFLIPISFYLVWCVIII